MTKEIWYHRFDCNVPQDSLLTKSLDEHGIRACRLDSTHPSQIGIVFFHEVTDYLCEFIGETSGRGLRRVLAVCVSDAIEAEKIWQLFRIGASDVLSLENMDSIPEKIAARLARWSDIEQLVESSVVKRSLVGRSLAWKSVLREAIEVARFTDASVLITGESGTGKELISRLIHTLDQRPNKRDLIILDCTTIVPDLSGSEFFGHERGAFTGAVSARDGAFSAANGGTLFLDEVGELPPSLQAQLLRVIQERTYKRVGGNTWQQTDFRLVCATNKNLLQAMKQGEFRSDLYYRIANSTCELPPLRNRMDDIIPLAQHFIGELNTNPEGDPPVMTEPVQKYLLSREYPGNVRELKQLVSSIMCRYVGTGPITVGDIPEEQRLAERGEQLCWCDESFERAIRQAVLLGVGLKDIGRAAENHAIRIAMHQEDGNLQRAARTLGITDRALQMRKAAQRQQQAQNAV